MESSKSYLYKKKSAVDGVDKRVLRAHQKTVEQKSRRDETVQKRRKLEPEPVKKAAAKDQVISRKEMLSKWRDERELKRKLEAKELCKKRPGFKVAKVENQDKDIFRKTNHVGNVNGQKVAKEQQVSKPKTEVSTAKPEVSRRQTRSSTTTVPQSTRVTRNNTKAKPAPPVKKTRKGKENAPKPKSVNGRRSKKETISSEEEVKVEPCRFNAKTIRVGRGDQQSVLSRSESDSESFAPVNFTFTAPVAVKPFVLKPISPSSVVKVFSGTDSGEEESVFHSPPSERMNRNVSHSPVESSFQPLSFYGNKENKVSKHPTPSASQRRKSVRKSLAECSSSASEAEGEICLLSTKGRRKSRVTDLVVCSPRKSTRRSHAPKSSAVENMEETTGAAENVIDKPVTSKDDKVVVEAEICEDNEHCKTLLNTIAETDTTDGISAGLVASVTKTVDHFAKTPVPMPRSSKKYRRSTAATLARLKSPEERVEVLSKSPMVEMVRRTPKTKSPVDQFLPAFDDNDFLGPPPPMMNIDDVEEEKPTQSATSVETPQESQTTSATSEQVHDVPYFRALLVSETEQLNILSVKWDEIYEQTKGLSEEVEGQIRTTSGQAQLLISQRFRQFRGLVDNCEFNTGLKLVDCTDLQGFWDMIYFQVEDVNDKFDKLEKLRASGWVMDKPKVKKVVKKKVAAKPIVKTTARSKFADFRAKLKQPKADEQHPSTSTEITKPVTPKVNRTKPITPKAAARNHLTTTPKGPEDNQAELKTFEGGFFQVASPINVVPPTPTNTSTTPVKQRSLMKTALSNSASRRSLGIVSEMPKSAIKARVSLGVPSPLLPGCMAERTSPRQSAASPVLVSHPRLSVREKTPIITEIAPQKSSSTTPALEALRLDDSISSGDDHKAVSSPRKTPARRSSVRKTPKSEKSVKFSCSSEEMDVDEDFVSKYCMPTIKESSSKPVMMDIDPFEQPIEDEDMPGQMKRALKGEFDKHSKSAEKASKRRSVTSVLKSTKKMPGASKRRSVRFMQSPSGSEEMAAPLPRTPFNKDSIVPERRRSNRLSSSDSVLSSSSRHVSTPRPAKPWSGDLLMLDSPLTTTTEELPKVHADVLFTPNEVTGAAQACNDLICFTPPVTEQTPKRRKVESGRRRSVRISSRSEESLL